MSFQLDPTVKYHLQQHLVNMYNQAKAPALKIGRIEQLSAATKISFSEKVSECFGLNDTVHSYPELPKRNYLVARVDRWLDVPIFAVYSLEQIRQIQSQSGFGCINHIDWCVLEISEELEADLLTGVNLENELIISKRETILGEDWKNDFLDFCLN